MKFGDMLRDLRAQSGLSIRAVATARGVSHVYIADVEAGRRGPPSRPRIVMLLDAYGVTDRKARDTVLKVAEAEVVWSALEKWRRGR